MPRTLVSTRPPKTFHRVEPDFEAAVFDLDGLLIDSEPLWQDAEIEVFGGFGVELTREMCRQTMGLRIDEVVAHWHRIFGWTEPDMSTVTDRVVRRVIELIDERAELRPGVHEAIRFVAERVGQTAIASASTTSILDAVMDRFDLARHFGVIHSAEHELHGKPHPGVYLTTAAKLGAQPEACVALEDSINGVIAAKAARMTCIAVPEGEDRAPFGVADLVLESLLEIPTRWSEL